MQEKQLDKESMKGTIYVAALCSMFQHRRCSDKVDSVEFHHDPGNPQYFFIYADRIIYGHHKTKVCMEQNGVVWEPSAIRLWL